MEYQSSVVQVQLPTFTNGSASPLLTVPVYPETSLTDVAMACHTWIQDEFNASKPPASPSKSGKKEPPFLHKVTVSGAADIWCGLETKISSLKLDKPLVLQLEESAVAKLEQGEVMRTPSGCAIREGPGPIVPGLVCIPPSWEFIRGRRRQHELAKKAKEEKRLQDELKKQKIKEEDKEESRKRQREHSETEEEEPPRKLRKIERKKALPKETISAKKKRASDEAKELLIPSKGKKMDGVTIQFDISCHRCKVRKSLCQVCPNAKTHRFCTNCLVTHWGSKKLEKIGCPLCNRNCNCAACQHKGFPFVSSLHNYL